MVTPETITCRLCGGSSRKSFSKILLSQYNVDYYTCTICNSQQTQEPYWLGEAYAIEGVHIDVGSASRSIKNWLGASMLLDKLEIDKKDLAVDFGSGVGLFVRLMRDVGYNFLSHDKYSIPSLSNYFATDHVKNAKLITAFEVFEHLPNPTETLTELFSAGADIILFTTWFCDDQEEDWIYYLPECGQHVFFYSQNGLRDFAAKFGYEMTISHFFMVLAKKENINESQKRIISDFSLNSLEQLKDTALTRIEGVFMGNEYIDRDLSYARELFEKNLSTKKSG